MNDQDLPEPYRPVRWPAWEQATDQQRDGYLSAMLGGIKTQPRYASDRFSEWRRAPYKRAICRAYSDGIINSRQLHELCERIDRVMPWWRTDRDGRPIETFMGRPIQSFVRIVLQNLRKITG